MFRIVKHWFLSLIALLTIAHLVNGIYIEGFSPALMGALLLNGLNAMVRPVLALVVLPLNLPVFGFVYLVLNGLTLKLTACMVNGFAFDGFWPLFWGALLMSIFGNHLNRFRYQAQAD